MVGLEGNKDPAEPNLKNIRYLSLLEDRNFGESGKIPLVYTPSTGRLLQPSDAEIQKVLDTQDEIICKV